MQKACGTGNIEYFEWGIEIWKQLAKEEEKRQVQCQTCSGKRTTISKKRQNRKILKIDAGRMI